MSAILTINMGEYAILASDTRLSKFIDGRRVYYRDGASKVRRTSLGLMVAVGLERLIDRVAVRCEPAVGNMRELVELVREERAAIRELRILENADTRNMFDTTRCYFSFVSLGEMRVAFYDPMRSEDGLAVMGSPGGHLIVPFGAKQEDQDGALEQLGSDIRPDRDVRYHTELAIETIRSLGQRFGTSSTDGHVGVHTADGKIAIGRFDGVTVPELVSAVA